MKIVQAASEFFPFVKTGGLADVTASLSKALASYGHEVSVFLPGYRSILERSEFAKAKLKVTVQVEVGQEFLRGDIYELKLSKNLTIYVVRRDEYFDRRGTYGVPGRDYDDNDRRFIFFSKAIIEAMHIMDVKADILHCHDWQTGLVPLFLRLEEQATGDTHALKTFFTIHNMSFQGLFQSSSFGFTNLPEEFLSLDGIEYFGQISLMKAGISFADKVLTVSPSYAKEILTPDFGYGMNGILQAREHDLIGISNGIDVDEWNPGTDSAIPAHFSKTKMAGKAECRKGLLEKFGLKDPGAKPVYGMVCRLTQQKGVDLIIERIKFFVQKDCRLVILGKGDAALEKALLKAAKDHPEQIAVKLEMNEDLAHMIEAGADFFLLPSIFEPCGLNQMYSQRYGTIPITSRIGGLQDTVVCHCDNETEGTGLCFSPDKAGLKAVLKESLDLFADKKTLKQMQIRGMSHDFSWKKVGRTYEDVYINSI